MDKLLGWLESSAWQFDSVPRADGRFLNGFVITTKRQQALEMGSAVGYSSIWIGLGMEMNNGRLDTIEINPSMARQCRDNVRSVGLEKTVNCIEGDALKVPSELGGPFDLLFIDLGPMNLLPFLKAVEPKLTKDAIIALHNLGFESSYRQILKYSKTNGWSVEKIRPKDGGGLGFFIIKKSGD